MPFETVPGLEAQVGPAFGEYLTSFVGERGEVRAEMFRRGGVVTAYVSFPTGLDGGRSEDSYYSELKDYAQEHGFSEKFRIVYES